MVGVNFPEEVLRPIASFLHCKIGRFPLQYLALPIGANPRSKVMWSPFIEKVEKKLRT